jgi:hypothetical protein
MSVDVLPHQMATPNDTLLATREIQNRMFSLASLPDFQAMGGLAVTTTSWSAHTSDGTPIHVLTSAPSVYQPMDIAGSDYVGIVLGDQTGLHNGPYYLYKNGDETVLEARTFQDDDNGRFDNVRPDYDVDTVLEATGVRMPHQLFSWLNACVVRPHESMSTRTRVRIGAVAGRLTGKYASASLQTDSIIGGTWTSIIDAECAVIAPRKASAVSFTSRTVTNQDGLRSAEASYGEMRPDGIRTPLLTLRDLEAAKRQVAATLEFARMQTHNPFTRRVIYS